MYRLAWTASALVCVVLASCSRLAGDQRSPSSSFVEAAVKRPPPDLLTLAERCSPRHEGPDAIEAFYDLLKLREQPDPQAVPVLERVLHDHRGATRIHRFAAAQALFAIGTPQAQQVLERQLLSPDYPARDGIGYAFFHEMNPALRDGFIERYHLRNLAGGLSLGLAVTGDADSTLLFTLTATNMSASPLRFLDPGHSLTALLFLRSDEGVFVPAQDIPRAELDFVRTKAGSPWVHLPPGARHEWRIVFRKRSVRDLEGPHPGLARDSQMVLESDDGYFDIRHAGRFHAIAILDQPDAVRALPGCADGGTCWVGRAVSTSVLVEVRG